MEGSMMMGVEGIKKTILHGGTGEKLKFVTGSIIVTFHFRTQLCNDERTVIDDSKKAGMPMEMVIGNLFKLDVWEILLMSMNIGEVAEFCCDVIVKYDRESWALNESGTCGQGNKLFKQGRYDEATLKYKEAIMCIKNVQTKEKAWEAPWLRLEKMANTLTLNYCQCLLCMEEYYEVIEHTTDIINQHPGAMEAFYLCGKAHMEVWNEAEARDDFMSVLDLDPGMKKTIKKEFAVLKMRMELKNEEDRLKYKGMFTKMAREQESLELENPDQEIPEQMSPEQETTQVKQSSEEAPLEQTEPSPEHTTPEITCPEQADQDLVSSEQMTPVEPFLLL
uniref:Aryl hydrocarbon receptor interacting protein like 1 n=1 Tax=Sinocyclocheilus grahami TaxID=75366 RepID=A0A672SQS4_SINGR